MRKKLIIFIVVILAAVVTGCVLKKYIAIKKYESENKITVKKWDNIYNGDNIHYYFEKTDEINLQQLKDKYKLDVLVGSLNNDLEKAVKIMDWVSDNLKYDDNSMKVEGNAQKILEDTKNHGNTVNGFDYCRVYQETASSIGLTTRIGQLKTKYPDNWNNKTDYYVCEVWCKDYNKWIMLDPYNKHYFRSNSLPLNVIEIMNTQLDKIKIEDGNEDKKYVEKLSKFLYSYTISIDNAIYTKSNINSEITYIKNKDNPIMYRKNCFDSPSIYTYDDKLFNVTPLKKYVDNKSDKKATLIFAQKYNKDTKKITLCGGAFKNSIMINNYYVSINGGTYNKINDYFEVDLKKGDNIIKLSEDMNTTDREVIIKVKE